MTGASIRRALLAPAVMLTAGACFATRNDMRVVQADLQVIRQEAATARTIQEQREVANQARTDSVLASLARTMAMVGDTVRTLQATTMRLRGDVREDLVAIRQQLITVEQFVGASAQRIQELRAQLEADAAERSAPTVSNDTTKPQGSAAPPGPAQLYQMAEDQRRRGSWGSARTAYGALLQQFPTSDLAPDALYGIAQAWENEGNGAAADSVYKLVVTRFPQSERAPTALYKRATALRVTGHAEEAKVIYREIIAKYPRSEAAVLSEGFLSPPRKP